MTSKTTKNLIKALNEQAKCEHFYANGLLWRDCTQYLQETTKRTPTSYEAYIGDIRIQITYSDTVKDLSCSGWVFICRQLGLAMEKLSCDSRQSAAEEAYSFCRNRVNRWNGYFITHTATQN